MALRNPNQINPGSAFRTPYSAFEMLVVFDLDGTLVDSSRDIADSANALLESYGAAPLDQGRVVSLSLIHI